MVNHTRTIIMSSLGIVSLTSGIRVTSMSRIATRHESDRAIRLKVQDALRPIEGWQHCGRSKNSARDQCDQRYLSIQSHTHKTTQPNFNRSHENADINASSTDRALRWCKAERRLCKGRLQESVSSDCVAETLLEKTRSQQLIVNRQALGNLESSLVCTKVTFCTPVDSRIVDAYQTLAWDYWRLRSNSTTKKPAGG
jgi:hypothetical protein